MCSDPPKPIIRIVSQDGEETFQVGRVMIVECRDSGPSPPNISMIFTIHSKNRHLACNDPAEGEGTKADHCGSACLETYYSIQSPYFW